LFFFLVKHLASWATCKRYQNQIHFTEDFSWFSYDERVLFLAFYFSFIQCCKNVFDWKTRVFSGKWYANKAKLDVFPKLANMVK